MIGAFLEASTRRPHDAELREKMLLAAATAGAVIAHTGTIALHALGYRLTLDHGVHHGLANAILLHPFLCVTREYEPAKVQDILDALLGAGATLEDLRTWAERLGIDMALSKYGVKRTEFAAMAGYVMGKKNLPDNPFAVTAEAVCQVLSLAMDARRGSLVRKGP